MTTFELFDPDSLEFRKRNLTDLVFWKQYADERAEFHDSISKKTLKLIQENRRKLSKIDGYKHIPLLRSFEAALSNDESHAEAMRSMSTSYGDFSRELLREMDKQCSSSEYEKEAIGYRKLVKLHRRTLKDVESDKDKIKNITFKMEKLRSHPDKHEKYDELKHSLEDAFLKYDTNKECELLLRGKVVSKAEELQQLWTEEEKQRLDVLADGWKKCLNTEDRINSKLLAVGNSKAMTAAENIDNGYIIEHLATKRKKTCTFKDFEDLAKISVDPTEGNEVTEFEPIPPSTNKRRRRRKDRQVMESSSDDTEQSQQQKDEGTKVSKASSMSASDKSSLFLTSTDRKETKSSTTAKGRKRSRQMNRHKDTDVVCRDDMKYTQERQSYQKPTTHVQRLTSSTDSSDDDFLEDKIFLRPRKPVWNEDNEKPKARVLPQVKITVSDANLMDSSDNEEFSNSNMNKVTSTNRRSTLSYQKRRDPNIFAKIRVSRSNEDDKLSDSLENLSKEPKYICASDVLELRDMAPRRLNQFIRMVAVMNYNSNSVDGTFSMKKGETIVMTKTPDIDGLAFGWKKIRLNTKTKFGKFPVQFVKIDTSVKQNLQKTLEQ